MNKFYVCILFFTILLFSGFTNCKASTDTIPAGSYIINMGVIPQTIGNGLKPYGLVYALVKNYKIPVKWVVNTGKTKDGIDFTHNGIHYRGGTFIIPYGFRTPAINGVIGAWEAQGVVGNTSVSEMVLEVIKTIYYAPNWTMDKANGTLVTNYFANAGIPSSAYGGDSANWKTPADLNACDDIFVLPHADPSWSTHNNLYNWNQTYKGNIWAACHAVSELENTIDPVTNTQLNFLSTTGLVDWTKHKKDASPPYLYQDHGHPVMQFMQTLDEATNIGSEKTYLPRAGGAWRSTTTLGVYDETSTSIPSLSNGPAAVIAYGRAYGDTSRGWVMYEAGHDHNSNGTEAEKVAAQRAFFNYSFFVAVDRFVNFETKIDGLPEVLIPNEPESLSFSIPPGIDMSYYTIQWTSSCGGSFSPSANSQSVTFTPAVGNGPCIVSVTLTDGCGREIFSSEAAYINSVLSSPNAFLKGTYQAAGQFVQLNWSPSNNQSVSHYEIQRSTNGAAFKTIALFMPDRPIVNAVYSYKDPFIIKGAAYYRLVVINEAKAKTYSNIIKISDAQLEEAQLTVLSNPVRGSLVFEYQSAEAGSMTAGLVNMSGRVVNSRQIPVSKGIATIQMGNYSHLPAGIYLLRVTVAGKTVTQKVSLIK
jgi:hypothetical protein